MNELIGFAVRHGQTELNKNDCFRSWLDVPLDETGEQQADRVAQFLSKYHITRVFSSPLKRAMYTAHTFTQNNQLPIEQHGSLLPWHLGVFAGLPKDSNRDALELFVDNRTVAPPNGETLEAFEDRCFEFFDGALQDASPRSLVVFFTHTSNITALDNLASGESRGGPESGETVGPGGIVGIYQMEAGYRIDPVFGQAKKADFAS